MEYYLSQQQHNNMEHITTPETAQRLKDAGFPQPEFQNRQFWYLFEWDEPVFITDSEGMGDDLAGLYDEIENIRDKSHFFAPTATDILRELGKGWVLVYDSIRNEFLCSRFPKLIYHTNPAEAAALAWLDKHESKH